MTSSSPDTVEYLQTWLKVSGIGSGAVFPRLIGRGRIGPRLQVDAIAQTFKRVAEFVGMTDEEMRRVSGHSIRVGATQDMLALNIDLAFVMHAGRWKTTVMPMRYGRKFRRAAAGWRGRPKRRGGRSELQVGMLLFMATGVCNGPSLLSSPTTKNCGGELGMISVSHADGTRTLAMARSCVRPAYWPTLRKGLNAASPKCPTQQSVNKG